MNLDINLIRFFNSTPDLVCMAGKDGYFKRVNQAVINTLGYTKEELLAHPISDFIHPDDAAITARRRAALLDGEVLQDFENRYLTKSGAVVWLHWTSVYFAESELVLAIAKNFTRRKLEEIGLEERFTRFQNLVSHFKSSLEKDKKEVAIELHEELAQIAAVVKADIHWLKSYHTDAAAQDRIDHALSAAELLIRSIRKLSYSISPAMMEDVGLADTLEWLCAEFSAQHNIACSQALFCHEDSLSHAVKMDLFRICQEALNNFVVFANPQSVTIHLAQTDTKVVLSISDDGIDVEPEMLDALLAATSLRERVDSLHGTFSIESTKSRGKTLLVTFNLENGKPAPVLETALGN